jgi:hypothetical protein
MHAGQHSFGTRGIFPHEIIFYKRDLGACQRFSTMKLMLSNCVFTYARRAPECGFLRHVVDFHSLKVNIYVVKWWKETG